MSDNTAGTVPSDLCSDGRSEPLAVFSARPTLTWKFHAPLGPGQSAYQVQVATSADRLTAAPDVWDSGWVDSPEPRCPYGGRPTESRERLAWRVRVRSGTDEVGEWSRAANWEGGLFHRSDWSASWVRRSEEDRRGPDRSVVLLRRAFTLARPGGRARVYSTALGAYDLYLNGRRLGDTLFRPGWTDYQRRIQYQALDVTPVLREGRNVIGAALAPGWYSGRIGSRLAMTDPRHPGAAIPELLVQLEVGDDSDSSLRIVSDESWEWLPSSIVASDFYDGEVCDRRLQRDDWCDPEGDSGRGGWLAVINGMGSAGRLVAERSAPVREIAVTDAAVTWRPDGSALVDSGRNDAGYLRFEVNEDAGRRIEVRYSEVLEPAGNLYRGNLGTAACTDIFVCAGSGAEELAPSFTYRGFRFAEIFGLSERSRPSKVSAVSISTDLERVGSFRSSLALLEQMYALAEGSLRSNYLEVPTDCPQRSERLGWMADASLFAGFASYTYDIESFMSKWCDDILDARSPDGAFSDIAPRPSASWWGRPPNGAPGWTDAGVQLPWLMYQRYGDVELLERMFPAIERWMRWLHGLNEDGIWEVGRGNDYGDWVPAGPDTSHRLIATCWLHSSTVLAGRIAAVLGREQAEQWLAERGEVVRRAFAARFVDEGSGTIADPEPVGSVLARSHFGEVVASETQTGYVMALWSGVVAGSVAERAVRRLGELVVGSGHRLETGIVGSAKILQVLEAGGYPGLAYDLLLREDYPSLGFMVKMGSTSVWERWDGLGSNGWPACPTMNSFNHYALGSMLSWLVEGVCGLRPASGIPGLREFRFAPALSRRVPDVAFELETPRGPISLTWRWRDDSVVEASVDVPAGATCRVASLVSVDERLDGARRSEPAGAGGDELVLGAGHHEVAWSCLA